MQVMKYRDEICQKDLRSNIANFNICLKNSCFKSFLTLKSEHYDKERSLKVLRKLFQSAIQLCLVDCVPYVSVLRGGVSSSLFVVYLVW